MGDMSGPNMVVGVDGSAGSERALRWAAQEARNRHAHLLVVLAWEPAYLASYSFVVKQPDRADQERNAKDVLGQILRSVFGPERSGDVAARVIEGPAVSVLVQESCSADLLVLGASRPRDSVASSVGPVIRGCLNQARCPVMIIGPRDRAPAQPRVPALVSQASCP